MTKFIANVIVSTEQTYLNSLSTLIKFKEGLGGRGVLGSEALSVIFQNVEELQDFHSDVFQELKTIVSHWSEFADLLAVHTNREARYEELYGTFIRGYAAAMARVGSESRSNTQFRNFLHGKRSAPTTFAQYLAAPLSHLLRTFSLLRAFNSKLQLSASAFSQTSPDSLFRTFSSLRHSIDAIHPLIAPRERLDTLRRLIPKNDALKKAYASCVGGVKSGSGSEAAWVGDEEAAVRFWKLTTEAELGAYQLKHLTTVKAKAETVNKTEAKLNSVVRRVTADFAKAYEDVLGSAKSSAKSKNKQLLNSSMSLYSSSGSTGSVGSDMTGSPPRSHGGRPHGGSGEASARSNRPNKSLLTNSVAPSMLERMAEAEMGSDAIEDAEGQLMWQSRFGGADSVSIEEFFSGLENYLEMHISSNERRLIHFVIDPDLGNGINVLKFADFLKGFGPLTSCVHNTKWIMGSTWFYGFVTHRNAIKLLEPEPVGTYLLRFSQSKPGSFALEATILNAEGEPFVLPIQVNSMRGGGFSIHESEAGDREFASLQDLINYYTAYLLQPLGSRIPFEPWFHGDISSNEAEDRLYGQPDGTFLIRFSSRPGCYASSFTENGSVRHALILGVDGGGCVVEGDSEVYPSVPDLVNGFAEGLQRPLVNPENTLMKEMFDLARDELRHETELGRAEDDSMFGRERSEPSRGRDRSDGSRGRTRSSIGGKQTSSARALIATGAADPVDLIYMPDNKNVKAGTLGALVDHLLENTASKFANAFLLTYHSFTEPPELLGVLTYKYMQLSTGHGDPSECKKLRLRICNFLKSWSQKHVAHMEECPGFIQDYQAFTHEQVVRHDGENLARQMMRALDRAGQLLHEGGDDAASAAFIFSSKAPKPELPRNFANNDWELWDVSAKEIARQLTLVEEKMFRAVTEKELLGLAWTKKDKERRSPNLLYLIDRFNRVSGWVKESILRESDLKQRAKVFEFFVRVCHQLGKLNNFNCAMEVTSALESAAIHRLKKTKAKVSDKLMKKYETVHEKLNRAQSYKALREAIHSATPPVFPYVGMFLSDLTFIEEGNPSHVTGPAPDGTEIDLINFHRQRLIAQVINDEICNYQQAPYNLQRVPAIQSLMESMIAKCTWTDDECYERSLVVEPRGQ